MMEAILRTEQLSKHFGGVVATDRITFALQAGELRCLIGPNGAGKSTLFSLLCGIHRPDHGRIFLQDREITRLPAFKRVRLGMGLTFQTNRAFHNLTVQQNVDAPLEKGTLRRNPRAEQQFRYALEAFDLAPHFQSPARELPHHKLQWLEICMVLAGGPDILLLDEPTAGMGVEETRYTATVLQRLNEDGLTIVVVEHDIAFVRQIAKLVSVLHQGRLFAEGTVAEITQREDVRQIYLGRA